jgi:hypothetical protein
MRCEICEAVDALGHESYQCRRDAVRRCLDCGRALCRNHAEQCCGESWCGFCIELHQTDEHVPLAELVS